MSHIKYIAAVVDTWVYGLYPVVSVGTKEFPNVTPSHRLVFNLGDFCAFEEGPMKYGIYQNALRGVSMTMEEVRERRVKTISHRQDIKCYPMTIERIKQYVQSCHINFYLALDCPAHFIDIGQC